MNTREFMKLNDNVSLPSFKRTLGPFVILVTDPKHPADIAYPKVVSPSGGYPTKEAALAYIELFAKRKESYLGLHFRVVSLDTEDSFGRFCSWED